MPLETPSLPVVDPQHARALPPAMAMMGDLSMKKCPDCAESIQEDARKCRFCGYRYDEAEEGAPANPATAAAATSATTEARWPRAIGVVGGLALALGAGMMTILTVAPRVASVGYILLLAAGLALGGLLLAIAWFGLLLQGKAGLGVVGGSLAVPVAIVIAASFTMNRRAGLPTFELQALIAVAGLALCALVHALALGERALLHMRLARTAAIVSVVGLGIQLAAIAKHIDLPAAVQYLLALGGFGGLAVLGLGIALGMPAVRTSTPA